MGWTKEIDISIIIIAGTLIFGILSFTIILFYVAYQRKLLNQQAEHQRELLEATIQGQENERKRYSEDLHDELGTILSMVKLKIDLIENTKNLKYCSDAKKLLDEAIFSTKKISKALSPVLLAKFGLVKALQELAEKASTKGAIEIYFNNKGEKKRIDCKTELSLFRITQELLNNTIKHNQAKRIDIDLNIQKSDLQLIIRDDGKKFNTAEMIKLPLEEKGLGLKNIESRLTMLKASIEYESNDNINVNTIHLNYNGNVFN